MTAKFIFPGRSMAFAALCCCMLTLAACGSQPPAADWALNAEAAADRATQAYLRADQRVQALEWRRARNEVERTASPQLFARLALMRCAVEQASLQWRGCADFATVAVDADPPEQAYARYLQALPLSAQDIALLPQAQQPVAWALQLAARGESAALSAVEAVEAVKAPLPRLLAASVVLRALGPSDALLAQAVQTASAEGWRRPLLAWLLLSIEQAQLAGKVDLEQALERRLRVLQGNAFAADVL